MSSAWLKALLFCALCAAIALACHERPAPRFSHEAHLAGIACGGPSQPACLACADCHRHPPGREPQLPTVDQCNGCHTDTTSLLDVTRAKPLSSAPPGPHSIVFDHAKHLNLKEMKGQCVHCHSGAVRMESTLFPPMDQCLSCHEHKEQFENAQCGPCHTPEDLPRLRPVSFMRHDQSWLRHHAQDANRQPEMCGTCHAQSECDDCHDVSQGLMVELRRPELLEQNFVHSADFMSRHAMEARSQPGQCASCHQPETCDACHVERGISQSSMNPRNPHPPGWVGGNPASRDFHGRAARRDILSCAACHDRGPATNCIDCHKVGGSGGNPHPRGFMSSRGTDEAMCRYCHEP